MSRPERPCPRRRGVGSPRILVLTGRDDHCLFELLSRNRHRDERAGEIVAVASNHGDLRGLTEAHGVPFTHIPWPDREHDPAGTAAAHDTLATLIKQADAELVVLARFMRILDGDMCDRVTVLNIHHVRSALSPCRSFVPVVLVLLAFVRSGLRTEVAR